MNLTYGIQVLTIVSLCATWAWQIWRSKRSDARDLEDDFQGKIDRLTDQLKACQDENINLKASVNSLRGEMEWWKDEVRRRSLGPP